MALGGDGGGSWERGPRDANEYQEGRAGMQRRCGHGRRVLRLWGPGLGVAMHAGTRQWAATLT